MLRIGSILLPATVAGSRRYDAATWPEYLRGISSNISLGNRPEQEAVVRVRNTSSEKESSQLQMSAMIDVVFLLLIFFVMTFQITAVEGDVPIDMAQASDTAGGDPPREFQLHVHLYASPDGTLEYIQLDGRRLSTIGELRGAINGLVDTVSPDDCYVILHSDPDLQYQHAMDAITAIRGDSESAPGIQNIRFVDAK